MVDEIIDQVARDRASQALAQLNTEKELQKLRYDITVQSLEKLNASMEKFQNKFDARIDLTVVRFEDGLKELQEAMLARTKGADRIEQNDKDRWTAFYKGALVTAIGIIGYLFLRAMGWVH
jgi:hypothetical protein